MEEKEPTTSVKIFVSAKKALDEIGADRGIGKIELISRAMEWLVKQDRTFQAIVLGQVDAKDEPAILSLIKTRVTGDEMVASGDEAMRVATLTQLLLGPATKAMSDVLESHGPEYLARAQMDGVVSAAEVAAKVRRRKKNPESSKSA